MDKNVVTPTPKLLHQQGGSLKSGVFCFYRHGPEHAASSAPCAAVVTLSRDRESLEAEIAMEAGDAEALERAVRGQG
jgi:hypothetical protein